MDYRGYGGNPGRPSEHGLAADADAAVVALEELGYAAADRLFRRVLGLGRGCGAPARHPPAGMVLRSPFTELADVGAHHYPWLPVRALLRDRFPVVEHLTREVPITVIYGDHDRRPNGAQRSRRRPCTSLVEQVYQVPTTTTRSFGDRGRTVARLAHGVNRRTRPGHDHAIGYRTRVWARWASWGCTRLRDLVSHGVATTEAEADPRGEDNRGHEHLDHDLALLGVDDAGDVVVDEAGAPAGLPRRPAADPSSRRGSADTGQPTSTLKSLYMATATCAQMLHGHRHARIPAHHEVGQEREVRQHGGVTDHAIPHESFHPDSARASPPRLRHTPPVGVAAVRGVWMPLQGQPGRQAAGSGSGRESPRARPRPARCASGSGSGRRH